MLPREESSRNVAAGVRLTITMRAATVDDAEVLSAIAHAAKASWGYSDGLMRLWADELEVSPSHITSCMVCCAEEEDDVVGFYALAGSGASGLELDALFVRPSHIGRGVGEQLLRHAMTQARHQGATALRIVSDPHAEGFYRRYGAERIGMAASRPAGRELPVMRLPL